MIYFYFCDFKSSLGFYIKLEPVTTLGDALGEGNGFNVFRLVSFSSFSNASVITRL